MTEDEREEADEACRLESIDDIIKDADALRSLAATTTPPLDSATVLAAVILKAASQIAWALDGVADAIGMTAEAIAKDRDSE